MRGYYSKMMALGLSEFGMTNYSMSTSWWVSEWPISIAESPLKTYFNTSRIHKLKRYKGNMKTKVWSILSINSILQ